MLFIVVVASVLVVAITLALIYDHRAKRRGWRVGASTEEALHNRVDVKALERGGPSLQGGKQDWMTYRRRDRRS